MRSKIESPLGISDIKNWQHRQGLEFQLTLSGGLFRAQLCLPAPTEHESTPGGSGGELRGWRPRPFPLPPPHNPTRGQRPTLPGSPWQIPQPPPARCATQSRHLTSLSLWPHLEDGGKCLQPFSVIVSAGKKGFDAWHVPGPQEMKRTEITVPEGRGLRVCSRAATLPPPC